MNVVSKYGKTLVAVLGFVVTWAVAAWTDKHIAGDEWQVLVTAAANAVLVYVAPNYPGAKWIKPAMSLTMTVSAFLVANASGGVGGYEWAQLAVLALTTLGVSVTPSLSTPETRSSAATGAVRGDAL